MVLYGVGVTLCRAAWENSPRGRVGCGGLWSPTRGAVPTLSNPMHPRGTLLSLGLGPPHSPRWGKRMLHPVDHRKWHIPTLRLLWPLISRQVATSPQCPHPWTLSRTYAPLPSAITHDPARTQDPACCRQTSKFNVSLQVTLQPGSHLP